jgi:hypothetical protein
VVMSILEKLLDLTVELNIHCTMLLQVVSPNLLRTLCQQSFDLL